MKTKKFNIVIPLYKTEGHLSQLLDELEKLSREWSFEVIFVDDFSPDNTYQRLLEIAENYSFDMEVFRLGKNVGQHSATLIGLQQVKEEFAITIDDDLQHSPFEIPKLIQKYEETQADLIYGLYEVKQHSFIRNLGSKLLKKIVKWSNNKLDNITSFRLIKKEVLHSLKNYSQPIVFLDEYLIDFSSTVDFTIVKHEKRADGTSSYSSDKLFQFALGIILYHSTFPLRFITRLGLLMSITFFGIGIYYICQKLFYDAQIGFTSIIVSIFFSSGIILFALGIIGEYIRKIWVSQNTLNHINIRSHHVFKK